MTVDLKAIRVAAEAVKGWGNCDKAWLDSSEDEPAAIVGAVCEEGVRYPVATVDCDQYDQGGDSLHLAKFYATANPAAILELLDRLEAAEKDAARIRNEALEEAALKCDELSDASNQIYAGVASTVCAQQIRSMKK